MATPLMGAPAEVSTPKPPSPGQPFNLRPGNRVSGSQIPVDGSVMQPAARETQEREPHPRGPMSTGPEPQDAGKGDLQADTDFTGQVHKTTGGKLYHSLTSREPCSSLTGCQGPGASASGGCGGTGALGATKPGQPPGGALPSELKVRSGVTTVGKMKSRHVAFVPIERRQGGCCRQTRISPKEWAPRQSRGERHLRV